MYLSHHGILGMHWGVRRFQNKDGTLTPEGRKRYNKLIEGNEDKDFISDKINSEWLKDQKKKVGVKAINDQDDLIKKGSTFRRIADEDKIDDKRKYVSMLKSDNDQYDSDMEFLPMKDSNSAKIYEYQATRDLKVANGKNVCNHIIDTYGDKELKDFYYNDYKYKEVVFDAINSLSADDRKKREHEIKAIRSYMDEGENKVTRLMSESLFANKSVSDEVIKYYKDKGYDAIVDAEDFQMFSYPIILLDPKSSIKNKSTKSYWNNE